MSLSGRFFFVLFVVKNWVAAWRVALSAPLRELPRALTRRRICDGKWRLTVRGPRHTLRARSHV